MIGCPASCRGFLLPALPGSPGFQNRGLSILWTLIRCLFLSMFVFWGLSSSGHAIPGADTPIKHIRTVIPILGTTMNDTPNRLVLLRKFNWNFSNDKITKGLILQFLTRQGSFRPMHNNRSKRLLIRLWRLLGSIRIPGPSGLFFHTLGSHCMGKVYRPWRP